MKSLFLSVSKLLIPLSLSPLYINLIYHPFLLPSPSGQRNLVSGQEREQRDAQLVKEELKRGTNSTRVFGGRFLASKRVRVNSALRCLNQRLKLLG